MKARPIIIIVITLIIGFILGMLTSAQIRYNRLRPVRLFFSEERFREGFFRVIQPDEKQKEKINLLLTKYAKDNSTMQGDFRKKLDTLMKDFWKELEPVLTKDQLERLKQMEQRRNDMIRDNRRNPHDSSNFRDGRRMMPPGDSSSFREGRRMMQPPDGRPSFHGRDTLEENKEKIVK